MLEHLPKLRNVKTKRISSWDQTGKDDDFVIVNPSQTKTLALVQGPATIRHIWITTACDDSNYLRKSVLRMYWDEQNTPSVEVPLGDFFGVGHSKVSSYDSVVLNMSAWKPWQDENRAAMNCYFPMPFKGKGRIEITNECDVEIKQLYYYVDYEEQLSFENDTAYFHSQWRRNNPCEIPKEFSQKSDFNVFEKDEYSNLSDKYNYVILDAKGKGHFVGCNLSVHNLHGGWWMEGDDMFVIDGEDWPPRLHGTGSEDYFTHAWGMQPKNAFMYAGTSYHAPGDDNKVNELVTAYRYHVNDPVVFETSIRMSIEHGHANTRADDYSSTAYWYQTLPTINFPVLLPVSGRIPRAIVH